MAEPSAGPGVPLHPRYEIPTTISREAAAALAGVYQRISQFPLGTSPTSEEEWKQKQVFMEQLFRPMTEAVADALKVRRVNDVIGGVDVVRLRPPSFKGNEQQLIYLHGGGYVLFSAYSMLTIPALVAAATGLEVISIDYTLAPEGNCHSATDQVVAVWKEQMGDGRRPGSVGMFGDSAGGGLAAGSILKMRDLGLPLPGALYLISPWSDIADAGDTFRTLASFDPTLTSESLASGATAYVAPEDQHHPYASPLNGDYSQPFPPTLIQAGTREILLSQAIRHYDAIASGEGTCILDIYEGMPHAFQALIPHAPETQRSITRAAAFFAKELSI
ncbi:alpha/beta hydrolase fold domain-containing protein [Halopseudomonas salegens]|uniref:Acetyl esterase/lipase n=1 Tax=Halopseudomonas salegens TaxID=1434072 RepID=A0A1H2E4V6_9GAMM|nr:alpha/beta hydrolase [Halopseudomonas salegens]SDT90151.1 Acetyl esterase/lipase [Halopseudomonas salegens]